MHAALGKETRAFDFLGAVDAFGRDDFNQRDEGAVCNQRTDARTLAERCWGRFSVYGRRAPELTTRACASMARMAERMARM
jgi:hypothetical protein